MSRVNQIELAEARTIYRRWGPTILRFCELFIGNRTIAEQITAECFVRFLREVDPAERSDSAVPLLRVAFEIASQSRVGNCESSQPLEAALVQIEALSRAVFILHSVLCLQVPLVAAICGISAAEGRQVWFRALVEIRRRLPQDFFKEQGK